MSQLVSVIICSIEPARFKDTSQMYARLLEDTPHEVIGIHDARSMCEGYNRGIAKSRGEVVIFSHDDIEIITPEFSRRLFSRLETYDLLGLAGTSRVCDAKWLAAGPPYQFGQVSHAHPGHFVVDMYGAHSPVIGGIQAVDGIFMAMKRAVVEKISFDERYEGFHCYDVDFTFAAFRAGFKLAVVNDIHAIHRSHGDFGPQWQQQAARFREKWQSQLAPVPGRPFSWSAVGVKTREEILEVITPGYWQRS
jgi:hypothetical protein